jgi:hypothetical protein
MLKMETVLFRLMAPVLFAVLAAPLFLGHVVVRLLIAGVQRRARDRRSAPVMRTEIVRPTAPTWGSPIPRRL